MRVVNASVEHSYFVHKTYNEFCKDIGLEGLSPEKYAMWPLVLASDDYKVKLLMHGKKVLGMTWGRVEPEGKFVIHGKFLRRAWRGKFRFTRGLFEALVAMTKDFDKIEEIVPAGKKPKGKIIATVVSRRG